jgi:4-amino-4-deoxy-L-arabinose transferase-like glycosyltransferase
MKRLLPFLAALALTTPFWSLGHPLWEVDDARYAEVPREMAESGNWLTPSLNYVDYIEKPPLIYWLGAASYSLFGVSEAAARVPLALFAVLGMLGAGWLGRWLFSRRVGLYAIVILGTCAQFFGLSHLITPDLAVSVCLLWATGMILRVLRKPDDPWAGRLAWVAMTFALLAKGLISVLFPAAWTVLLLLFFPKLRKGLKPLLFNWGVVFFAVVIGGWFWAMERANPGFFQVFVIEQHFQRFLDTTKYNRPGGWWYFFPVELVGSLPWTPIMLTAVLAPLLRWQHSDARDRQLALWAVFVFTFFTVSSSKLITYLLPVFAHQAVLTARLLVRLEHDQRLQRWVKQSALALGGIFALAALILPLLVASFPLPAEVPAGVVLPAGLLLVTLAAAQFTLASSPLGSKSLKPFLRVSILALLMCLFMSWGASTANDQISVKKMCADLNARIAQLGNSEVRLLAYDRYLHGVPFYTGRPVDVINWVGEMHYAKRFARYQHRFGDDNTIRALPSSGTRTFVTLRAREKERFLALPASMPRRLTAYGPWLLAEF